MPYKGICPICEANLEVGDDVQVSEILGCWDCNSLLVVDSIEGQSVLLKPAPQVEEDWGE